MTIDNRLNFDNHISTACNNQFNVMLRFRNIIFKDTMLKLYKAFILPHFYYCSSVLHFCGTRNSEKLEAVQYTTLLNNVEMTLYNKRIEDF